MIDTRLIERYAAEAWPAAEVREEEGWLLRHTHDVPRRRSKSTLQPAPGQALLLPFRWRTSTPPGICAAVQVALKRRARHLDGLLAKRGYRRDAASLVCVAPAGTVITGSRPAVPPEVTVAEHPTRQWLDAYVALDGHENSQEAADQVLSRIPGPAAYLSAERGDHRVVSMGLIVAAPGCGGVFCMTTTPHTGGRGSPPRPARRCPLGRSTRRRGVVPASHGRQPRRAPAGPPRRIPRLAHLPLPAQALTQSPPRFG